MRRPLLKFYPVKNGFFSKPLEEEYRKNQILQKERSPCAPHYQSSVIKMNSTFLECSDGYFRHKGLLTIMLGFPFMFGYSLVTGVYDLAIKGLQDSFDIIIIIMSTILLFVFLYFLSIEFFRYTHYPLRFNRKTRKVYKYNYNGTVMVEDWDKLIFCLAPPLFLGEQIVNGFRMAEDGDTVLDNFAMPFYADKDEPMLLSQWEFVRRYMEEPKELPHLAGQVESVSDIAERRETWFAGFKRLMLTYTGGFPILVLLFFPLYAFNSIGRWLAMQTCTIPVWPEEVERECQIEPNDPYLRDRDHLAAPGTVPKPERMKR
jgi:hypothetical protein